MPKRIIIMHGSGSRIADAVRALLNLNKLTAVWENGVYFVERRQGLLVQRILQEKDPSELYRSYQKFIIGKLLLASFETPRSKPKGAISFFESRLMDDFERFAIPYTPDLRFRRSTQLVNDAAKVIRIVNEKLQEILNNIQTKSGETLPEAQARDIVVSNTADLFRSSDILRLIESVRETYESGGDLDSIASAALYTYWIKKQQPDARPGVDYDYAFLNYHERLNTLSCGNDTQLLIADFPLDALPHFADDARELHERGCTIERFEDHHPITPEQRTEIDTLITSGVITFADIFIPQDETRPESAAEIIYKNLFKGNHETDGAAQLIKAVRSAEFGEGSTPLAAILTDVAASDISKIEIVEELVSAIELNAYDEILRMKGWNSRSYREDFKLLRRKLLENLYVLRVKRRDTPRHKRMSPAFMSDAVLPNDNPADNGFITILAALAPQNSVNMPKMYVGKAAEYLAKEFPFADYLLYCYGSNIVHARRFNNSEYSINLDELIKSIATKEDGLVEGVAAGSLWLNRHYPYKILGRVNSYNFRKFTRYLAKRLRSKSYEVKPVRAALPILPAFPKKKHIKTAIVMILLLFLCAGIFNRYASTNSREKIRQDNLKLTDTHLLQTENSK